MTTDASQDPELVKAAEELLSRVKQLDGDVSTRLGVLQQLDKLRYSLEHPMDTINRHWDNVSS
jgi:hypothetical protein